MSNLLKFNSVVIKDQDKLVIDSNRMVDEIIEQRRKLLEESGNAPVADSDGFVCGLEAAMVEELISDEEEVKEVHHEIDLEAIKLKEEELLNEARLEAEKIKAEARTAGYEAGLSEGRAEASLELDKKLAAMDEELFNKKEALEREYQTLRETMEPELVETLIQVFSKVTHTIAEGKKGIVIALANTVLKNTEMSKSYLVKVSEEDYGFVASNVDMISQGVAKDVKIDVCIDFQLSRNQCIIETDLGVFDCSLDIQLENLINDIRLLSCLDD